MQYADRPCPLPAGFTLLEVVVALAVVSLGLIAAFNLIVQISSGSLHMKEKTFAGWIASNEITRLRLSGDFPDVSEFDGDVEFAGSVYRWRATVSETGVDNLRRVDMDVSYAEDPETVIGRSVGFLTPAAQPRLGGAEWSEAADSGPGAAEAPEDQAQDEVPADNPGQSQDAGDQGTPDSGQ